MSIAGNENSDIIPQPAGQGTTGRLLGVYSGYFTAQSGDDSDLPGLSRTNGVQGQNAHPAHQPSGR